jgi:ERCC4-type nuclease
MHILIDTREPWPHPWAKHLPEAQFEQQALETGDIALAANPLIVVERKTVSDFLGSITAGRERFERELARSRHLDHFCIIVEGSLIDCMDERGGLSAESLLGTVAAFGRRKYTIHFAGTERFAARLAWRILTQPVAEANKLAGAAKKAGKKAAKETPKQSDRTSLY